MSKMKELVQTSGVTSKEDKPLAAEMTKYTFNDFIGMDKVDLMNVIINISEGMSLDVAVSRAKTLVAERKEKKKAELAEIAKSSEQLTDIQKAN